MCWQQRRWRHRTLNRLVVDKKFILNELEKSNTPLRVHNSRRWSLLPWALDTVICHFCERRERIIRGCFFIHQKAICVQLHNQTTWLPRSPAYGFEDALINWQCSAAVSCIISNARPIVLRPNPLYRYAHVFSAHAFVIVGKSQIDIGC